METSKTLKVGSHKKNISKKNKVKLWDEFDIQEQTPQNAVSIKKIVDVCKQSTETGSIQSFLTELNEYESLIIQNNT